MAIEKVTGAVEIYLNGTLLLNKAGAVASGIGLSGEPNFELEAVMGDTGYHGFTERPIMAQLEVSVTDRNDVMVHDLVNIGLTGDESTVLFRARGGQGKSWTLKNAVNLRNAGLTAGEGEVRLRYVGDYWIERQT